MKPDPFLFFVGSLIVALDLGFTFGASVGWGIWGASLIALSFNKRMLS